MLPQGRARFENCRRQLSAAARRKPTGLLVRRNGCTDVHRGGPYWLPPRRAPFGRKENPPQAGVPPDSASPRSLVTVCEEARASMSCQEACPRGLRSSPPLGHMPRWLSDGNGAAGRDGGGVDCSLRERAGRARLEDSCADARNLPRSLAARLARWSWQRSRGSVLTRLSGKNHQRGAARRTPLTRRSPCALPETVIHAPAITTCSSVPAR